jgi:AsmA protein
MSMKILLRSLLILIGLVCALLLVLVALIFTLDPNRLKPLLEKQAAKRGIELHIPGDINWKLFPNLALSLGELNLHSAQDKTLLAAVNQAEVSVQLMPIFQRQIQVDGVRLDGLEVRYEIDAQGASAWDTIGGDDKSVAEPPAAAADAGTPPEFAVERVDITNLKLLYANTQTGDRAEIQNLNLQARDVAVEGEVFPLQLKLSVSYNDLPPVELAWDGPVSVNLETQMLKVAEAEVNVQVGAATLAAVLATETHWGEPLTSKGKITITPAALPPLLKALDIEPPQTANPRALQQVGGAITYDFGPDQLTLEPVALTLDNTRIDGQLQLKSFEKPIIITGWQGTSLVLNDYLPPEVEKNGPASAEPDAPPQPLPLEALRDLNLQAKVAFEKLMYKGLPMNQPQLQVSANNGLLKLETLSLQTADGTVSGEGQLDARGAEAQLQMTLQSQGVNLGTLLQTFADLDKVTGKVSATAVVTSHGATDKALQDNLVVEASAESEELQVTPINIEEQFCRALSILQQQTLPENIEWPDMTRLEPVKMQIRYADHTLNLQQLNATIANLLSAASGSFNLETGKFNVPFSLSLGEFANKVESCLPIEEKWRKRALPIRCKGSLDDIGPTTCLPDTKLLTELVKDRVKGEAREKLEAEKDRLENKLEDKAKELLKEKLGEEKGKNTEESVRSLLNQFKKKKDQPQPAAPAEVSPNSAAPHNSPSPSPSEEPATE